VTLRLKRYPAYRDCGIPWLGLIPEHWEVRGNGRLFDRRQQPGSPQLPLLEVSLKTGVRVRMMDGSGRKQAMADRAGYQRANAGDIAYNMMRMWQGALGIVPEDGLVSPAYVVALPRPEVDAGFYAYLFRTGAYMDEVDNYSRGIVKDRNRLYWVDFKRMPSVFPPTGEQQQISAFLGYFDRRINCLIRSKRRLIGLLEDQKQVIIHRAVTRGLDANVSLKPSGFNWLGDVPEHWQIRRLKTLLQRIDQGVSPQAEATLAGQEEWGVLKAGCVNHGVFRDTEHKRLPDGFSFDQSLAVARGDVLVSRASGSPKLVGSVAKIDRLRYQLILSDKTFRLVFKDRRLIDFTVATMQSPIFRLQIEQAISGAEGLANNLPISSLRAFRLPVPPIEEAEQIAAYLTDEMSSATRAGAHAEREICLLQEYRTRLVADVVTGQLDVRGVSLPPLPESDAADPEAELDDADDADLLEAAEALDEE